jgi:hypothetical protein
VSARVEGAGGDVKEVRGERCEVSGERWDDQSDEFSGEAAALI